MTDIPMRRTAGRERLLDALKEKRAWSASELHRIVKGSDLVTVYRNLKALLKHGLVQEVRLTGTEQRFELKQRGHHAHRVCERCGRADCIPCPLHSNIPHHLEIDGLCTSCRRH